MNKAIAIIQSDYIPWKGYFDLIASADEFILYDDVQFTKNDWRNRNKIKTPQGIQWLTIPVKAEGGLHKQIKDTRVANNEWKTKHRNTIQMNYARAPHYRVYASWLDQLYSTAPEQYLSEINRHFLAAICRMLEIQTPLTWVMDYDVQETDRNLRLIELCKKTGANRYFSGPAARDYLDVELFSNNGIEVIFFDYSNYPEYPQLYPPFSHYVSIFDLLLNAGPDAPKYLKPQRSNL